MNPTSPSEPLVSALKLPPATGVNRRVPKTLLIEHGAPTTTDKRRISDGIETLYWLATLKPTTIGVPAYRDATREYLEIAVLRLDLRPSAKAARLTALVHRAIPYPVLLLTTQAQTLEISAAHKRWAENEAGKTVLDAEVESAPWPAVSASGAGNATAPVTATATAALALDRQPSRSLFTLYQGWIDVIIALQAARITRQFRLTSDPAQTATRRAALRELAGIQAEIDKMRAAAAKERQMPRQVALNLQIQQLEATLAHTRKKL